MLTLADRREHSAYVEAAGSREHTPSWVSLMPANAHAATSAISQPSQKAETSPRW